MLQAGNQPRLQTQIPHVYQKSTECIRLHVHVHATCYTHSLNLKNYDYNQLSIDHPKKMFTTSSQTIYVYITMLHNNATCTQKTRTHYIHGHTIYTKKDQKFKTYFGKGSKNHVLRVSGKATLIPDINGEWRITPATSYLIPKSIAATVPMLCPYNMTLFGGTLYLSLRTLQAASASAYTFFSDGFPVLMP